MQRKLIAALLIFLGTIPGITQVNYTHKLKGRVTYLSSNYKPVAGAQVEAQKGANPTRTDNDGWFSLVFYRKEAGMDVQLKVRLGPLVVVNEKELAVTLKKDQEKEIKLYMCEKQQLDKLRVDYYDISITNITRRFREETERLHKDNKLSQEAVARLEREKQNLMEQAREYADRFARVNFDNISDMRQKAIEYYKAGDIKKAINTLDFETLVGHIDKADNDLLKTNQLQEELRQREVEDLKQREQGIQGLLDKAWYCRLDYQFELAKQCYEEAVKRDPENFDTVDEFADFLYNQAHYFEARPYYESLRSLADSEEKRGVALFGLGNCYSKNIQFSKAKDLYIEALQIFRQLAQKNPDAFLSDVAMTQNNLGVFYRFNNQFPEARAAFSEALQIFTQLAQKNPAAFLDNVATKQNNLGILYFSQNQPEKAREILGQAIVTLKQLTAKNPRAFEISLCKCMIFLGRYVHLKLLLEKNDLTHLEKAEVLINDAITRLKKYPEVPRAVQLLEMARGTKKVIDKIKKRLEKRRGPSAR